ncbi:MAG: hypothetical protein DBX93_04985 [Oscillospiraceae bacterium]|nr:MAG: hypothetical protein DBX93_04985 [Oscillospiraceae bacterium]
MRNLKKFLALMLATLMIAGSVVITTGAAKTGADYTDAAHHLAAIGIMKGDENGNLMLDKSVTRYQAALFFVQAITGNTDTKVWNADKSTVFTDVPEYGTAIDYLAGMKFILGRGNGIYGYNDPITYQDMLVLAVRALGYETADMNYPYGHILAARELGLTDNIDSIRYKEPLSRGETAQLVWDMLSTELAIKDPITGDLIYPGKQDASAYGALLGPGKIQRETYLERAGFADGKLTVTVKGFEAGKKDAADTVTVEYNGATYTLAAADLGITAETPKIGYLGLPMTLYVNCKAEDFFSKYDVDKDDADAKIVFTDSDALTTVENLGDAGKIRVIKNGDGTSQILLDGVKYTTDKYATAFYSFTKDGWTKTTGDAFLKNFAYTAKDGYTGANSNGAVKFIVRETKQGDDTIKTLHIYYMPYAFGQYFTRTLRDAFTSKDTSFVTIGTYAAEKIENKDGVKSNFVETLLGTTSRVTSATTSVSKKNGEAAKSVTLAGESVKSGDFMFYYYNAVDNILTVAQNAGGFRTGKLNSVNPLGESVRIDGAQKSFGFKGGFDASYSSFAANRSTVESIIKSYEKDKNNVRYVEVDGRIVFLEAYSSEAKRTSHDFAIVSADRDLLAKLMKVDADRLNYTADFVLDKDGNVQLAMLDTATGTWKLVSVDKMAAGYNADTDAYKTSGSIGTLATYTDIAGSSYTKYTDYVALRDALIRGGIFAVTGEKNGVYDLGTAEGAVKYATVDGGLIFSDTTAKTNHIKADPDANVSASRVTVDAGTVIALVDKNGNVGVRVGVQKAKFSVTGAAKFYAASSDLIVAQFDAPVFTGGYADMEAWGESRAHSSTETYYAPLADTELMIESSGEDVKEKYTVTITNLLDLRTMQVVASKSFNTDTVLSFDLTKALYASEDGVITHANMSVLAAFKAACLLNESKNGMVEIKASDLTFTDADTVRVDGGALNLPDALASVLAKVVTIDATGLDADKYDFTRLALNHAYSENGFGSTEVEIREDFFGYDYPLDTSVTNEITEPVAGVLDQFILDTAGMEILVPKADRDDYEGAASITVMLMIMAEYNENTGALTLNVARVLMPYGG